MPLPYEYNLIVRYFPISERNNLNTLEGQKMFSHPMAQFVQAKLPEVIASSGWTVNSHSITFYKNQAVLSILLQRGYL